MNHQRQFGGKATKSEFLKKKKKKKIKKKKYFRNKEIK